ncbi:MAG: efflux RND transporter periplasmic adaptor subunit [Cyclobacteriaceae bacterium]|nr:efflux RND transporter periplasmic adaptor subunit [Cyclobacteriaceae bacterium]
MKAFHVFIITLLMSGCGGREDTEEAIRPVFYQEIGKTSIRLTQSFSGVSQAGSEAKLSFRVGGTIEKLDVELGDTVRKGNLIARLDPADYRINYNKAILSLQNAEVQLATAKSSFLRIEKLYANNNASLNDYEKAKAEYETAEAMVKTARSQVEAARNQLDYTTLRAPFDGIISGILAEENEMTSAGRPVVAFSSIDMIEVKTSVPENIIRQIKKGQKVRIQFIAIPEIFFQGKITEVSPGTQAASAYPVIIQLMETSAHLYPGMTGTVEFPLNRLGDHEGGSLVILPDAVSYDQQGEFVFVAEKSKIKDIYTVGKRRLALGALTSDGYEIIEGLNKGDIVITAGHQYLFEGRKVKLLDDNDR